MHTGNIKRNLFFFLTFLILLAKQLGWASSAWAVQSHSGAEGLVAHQIGHVLFIVGMIFLLIRQHGRQLKGPGWQEFRVFLVLLIFWNCFTFVGHMLRELVDGSKFIKVNGRIAGYHIDTGFDLLFYLTRLDHLLLVPAFLFLFLALRRWGQSS